MAKDEGCDDDCGCSGDAGDVGTQVDESGRGAGAPQDNPPAGCALPSQGCHFVAVRQIQGKAYCEYECSDGTSYLKPCP